MLPVALDRGRLQHVKALDDQHVRLLDDDLFVFDDVVDQVRILGGHHLWFA